PQAPQLLALLRDAGHEVIYRSVRDDHWDHVLDESAELVVAAGGDGAIAKVIRRLLDRHLPLALLPTGTANNISRTLGLVDAPLEQLVSSWTSARTIRFVTGTARGPWGSRIFIESVGAGFFATMMAELDRQKPPGSAGPQRKDGLADIHKTFQREL